MKHENKLKSLLTGQRFESIENKNILTESAKSYAHGFALATEGVAVISNFHNNVSYIYSGKFGQTFFNLPECHIDNNSAFENTIFSRILKDDLLERHITELRFFHFLKNIPLENRTEYQATCHIRLSTQDPEPVHILHTTRYMHCLPNGSVWCGICTYTPSPDYGINEGRIINIKTGRAIGKDRYTQCCKKILSNRQVEVLSLLAKGLMSKQIAERLNISSNTVNRHRQDIIAALNVPNTIAAVEIGLKMKLI